MGFDQPAQFGVVHSSIIEVSTKGYNYDGGTLRLGDSVHQQFNEVLPLLFSDRLSEDFLELINEEHHSRFRPLCQVA